MGGVAWKDETTFYYVVEDKSHRPYQVWRHVLGEAQDQDVLVYEENDDLYNVACWRSLDGSLIFIEAESKETTEHLARAEVAPTAELSHRDVLVEDPSPEFSSVHWDAWLQCGRNLVQVQRLCPCRQFWGQST